MTSGVGDGVSVGAGVGVPVGAGVAVSVGAGVGWGVTVEPWQAPTMRLAASAAPMRPALPNDFANTSVSPVLWFHGANMVPIGV